MAHAIRPDQWLESEESTRRSTYWQHVVERWLWETPLAVIPHRAHDARGPDAPSTQALQDFGWIKEPESSISH